MHNAVVRRIPNISLGLRAGSNGVFICGVRSMRGVAGRRSGKLAHRMSACTCDGNMNSAGDATISRHSPFITNLLS